jgi:hypothetical protein
MFAGRRLCRATLTKANFMIEHCRFIGPPASLLAAGTNFARKIQSVIPANAPAGGGGADSDRVTLSALRREDGNAAWRTPPGQQHRALRGELVMGPGGRLRCSVL